MAVRNTMHGDINPFYFLPGLTPYQVRGRLRNPVFSWVPAFAGMTISGRSKSLGAMDFFRFFCVHPRSSVSNKNQIFLSALSSRWRILPVEDLGSSGLIST